MTFRKFIFLLVGSVGARLVGAALGLATQILIARIFVQADVGTIFLAMSMAAIFALLVSAGYPTLALTEFPRFLFLGRDRALRAFHGAYLREWLLVNSLLFAGVIAVVVFAPFDAGNKLALVFGALSSPVSALIRYSSAMANSLRLFAVSFVPDNIVRPGLLLVYVAVSYLIGLPLSVFSILTAFVVSNALAALVQLPFIREKGMRLADWHAARPAMSKILRSRSYALALVAGVSTMFADIVTLLGGFMLAKEDVAILGVTIRLAAIAGFVLQASQQYALPDLTAAIASRNERAVNRQLFRLNSITVGLAICGVAGATVFGGLVLGVFGEAYAAGQLLLILFLAGQSIKAFGGMNQSILSIAGKQLPTAGACLVAVVVLILGWLLFVPYYGLLGVGFAVIGAELVWAIVLAVQAKTLTGRRADLLWVLRHRNR